MAFVTAVGSATTFGRKASACVSRKPAAAKRKAVIRASRDLKERSAFSVVEENRRIMREAEEVRDKGFTAYAEKVNGRMAMIGFTLALLTEAIAPTHPSLVQQLFTLFPIHKLLGM
mmetsp:Transcript_12101/g.32577  ORF Transcript_12101/g.32577 Transcript_12101/m.32577 type:complete len:116 (+) Transcript_12101:31-378(+)